VKLLDGLHLNTDQIIKTIASQHGKVEQQQATIAALAKKIEALQHQNRGSHMP
jgi:uncharacterized coiled-coil protein SlyX